MWKDPGTALEKMAQIGYYVLVGAEELLAWKAKHG